MKKEQNKMMNGDLRERRSKMDKLDKLATARTPQGQIVAVEEVSYKTSNHPNARTYHKGMIYYGGVLIAGWNNSPFHNDFWVWSFEDALKNADKYLFTTALEYAEEEVLNG